MTAVEMKERTVDSAEDLKSLLALSDEQIFEISEVPRERMATLRLYIDDELREVSVVVVGETPKRYCVRVSDNLETATGISWVGADDTWLIPKGAIQFVKQGGCYV